MLPPDLPRPVCAYLYDTATLRARAASVRQSLPAGSSLLYAVKANGHPSVLETLAAVCDGLEVASGGELALALATGARRIVFGGPAKTDAELRAALDAGVLINAESVHELHRIAALAPGNPPEVVLRVNRPGSPLQGSHTMTGTPTPFGVSSLGDALSVPGVNIIGFHLHAVSNNMDGQAHAAFVRDCLSWSLSVGLPDLRVVNVGGGFGVDYLSDASMDLSPLRDIEIPPGIDLIFEPGRYLAADAGRYAAEVIDIKTTHGRTFAVLRGGTHHFRLPAAWGYSHPFTVVPVDDWPHPYPRPSVSDAEVDAVGELCTPRDVLTRGQHVAHLRAGDILVFARTGAYGWDISHHDFLRHDPPAFVIT
ncbi:alanine racemase [Paractinoplanes atraurantiacus]|uniref:Diaminopimelate decarboxylase n=1 Tax=Paractinoplanes atraurantiacus TaxID=1036182 RepID=A0A285I9Y9_9ACTN|nr:alanine racemase [Actinoplanes atraurantiacus]SNY44804.1 diaminopimelate decarboxylase [Actinoplanes atraurantiacus]